MWEAIVREVNMVTRLRAFVLGMRECHDTITTRVDGVGEDSYEYGRRFGRWVTRKKRP